MAVYRQDVDFQTLFRKLGHNLEEIRVRALDNIRSKLDHGLICEEDLVHERHLMIRLLEWFNFTPCPRQEHVLQLLSALSQHWGVVELLQGVGGQEFLTRLRQDVDPDLQPLIDRILENILRLPDTQPQDQAAECIYHKSHQAGGLSRQGGDSALEAWPISGGDGQVFGVNADQLAPRDTTSAGYLPACSQQEDASQQPPPLMGPHQPAAASKMSVLPWLPLTTNDRHVLHSTNKSLQSRDTAVLTSACDFLREVVFQDFPPEIFIQRPQILQSLLSLLSAGPCSEQRVTLNAAATLASLCDCLHTRIRFYQDPALYAAKQDWSAPSLSTLSPGSQSDASTDTRPSLTGCTAQRHRGDGTDADSSGSTSQASSEGGEPGEGGGARDDLDLDEGQSLQHFQMSMPQFAATVLLQALRSLRTPYRRLSTELLRLGFESWRLLALVLPEDVWESRGVEAKELVSKVKSCMEACSELLEYHHHSHHGNWREGEGEDGGRLRRVYVSVANLLSHLLHLLPHQALVPDRLDGCLDRLVLDPSWALNFPQAHSVMLHWAQRLDRESARLYTQALHVQQSIQDTCTFLLQVESQALSAEEAVRLVDSAVSSLPLHLHLPLIPQCVALCSRLSRHSERQSGCQAVLLKLLSHPLLEVRQHAYQSVLATLQSCLSPDKQASTANYTGHLEARFLLTSDLLYEVACFGLADSDKKVCATAMEVLLHLLQSQTLLGDSLWSSLMTALLPSLPVLQAYVGGQTHAGGQTRLARRVWDMLDPEVKTDQLCLLDKLRGTLRLLLAAQASVREEALQRVLRVLSHLPDSAHSLPDLTGINVQRSASLFLLDAPSCLQDTGVRSVFQTDGLKQVYDIFTADPVDPGVKRSAAEQLSIMLQDPHLHPTFRQLGGLEVILRLLHQATLRPSPPQLQNSNIPLVSACVTMLRHLLHYDSTLRHSLCRDPNIYYDLVRVSLCLVRDESVSYQVAHILTLLLFDEVIKTHNSSGQSEKTEKTVSLPSVITKRYRLPLRASVHHSVSPHAVVVGAEGEGLRSAAVQEMLRVAWNVAWCGGMDPLLTLIKKDDLPSDQLSAAMVLTATDRTLLRYSGLRWGLQEAVQAVDSAVSHAAVQAALQDIQAALATCPAPHAASTLHALPWTAALHRFVAVRPSSDQDSELLCEVLSFLTDVLSLSPSLPPPLASWAADLLHSPLSPLLALLTPPTTHTHQNSPVSRGLDKACLQFLSALLSRLPYKLSTRLSLLHVRGQLAAALLRRLKVSAVPHFYNLADLEATLMALLHLTARPGWSAECSEMDSDELCSNMLNCMLEVVSSFHAGRGGASLSYMGKGVTRATTLCLRHLAHEMLTTSQQEQWAGQWLYCRQGQEAQAQSGLNWMLTLWNYRDPEVRAAGLGMAVTLTCTETGRALTTSNCGHIPGGLWGAAFSILLDPAECSMVRQQAALLLVNLTSQTIPSSGVDAATSVAWQGPVVRDVETNVVCTGLGALLALLHHSHFYQQLSAMLTSLFTPTLLQPVLVTTPLYLHTPHTSASTHHSADSTLTRSREQSQWSPAVEQSADSSTRLKTSCHDNLLLGTTHSSSTFGAEGQLDSTCSTAHAEEGAVTPPVEGMSSVVTPCLAAALTQLLGNLVVMAPNDTFNSLISHNIITTLLRVLDTGRVQELCEQLGAGGEGGERGAGWLSLRDLLALYRHIFNLLRACVRLNSHIRSTLLADKGALRAVLSLLLLQCPSGGDMAGECRQLWLSVLLLLSSLLQTQTGAALHSLTPVLVPMWSDLSDALVHLLEVRTLDTEEMLTAAGTFLSLLLVEEGKRISREPDVDQSSLAFHLDCSKTKRASCESGEDLAFTSGAALCKVLVSTYEVTCAGSEVTDQGSGLQGVNALKCLLLVSQAAKLTALDMGLLETLVDWLKQTHATLSLETLQPARNLRRKDDPQVKKLIQTINILRNFVCGNDRVKRSCASSGLCGVLHKMWGWCQQQPSLMTATLSLLITLTSKCPSASTALAVTGAGAAGVGASRQQQISSSLVTALCRTAQREAQRQAAAAPASLRLLFSLLTCLALSPDCRSILCKSNMLQELCGLSPCASRKWRWRQLLDSYWLELAVALSFFTDGQQMLLRTDDCLTVLMDFMENGSSVPHCQQCAVLTLRNMCCHAPNKPKILANERVIAVCLKLVETSRNKTGTLAASALWALAHNNHKAKMAMKAVGVVPRLRACVKVASDSPQLQCLRNIRSLIATLHS